MTATYALLDVTVSATSDRVQVKSAADQLGELADAVTGVGPGESLAHKVAAVAAYAAAGDTADACAGLVSFSSEVSAQTGKKLWANQAAALLDRRSGHRGRARLLTASLRERGLRNPRASFPELERRRRQTLNVRSFRVRTKTMSPRLSSSSSASSRVSCA